MKAYEAQYAAAFYEFQQKELKRLRSQIAEGIDIRSLLSANSSDFWSYQRPLRVKLFDVISGARQFGEAQVAQEIEKQQ